MADTQQNSPQVPASCSQYIHTRRRTHIIITWFCWKCHVRSLPLMSLCLHTSIKLSILISMCLCEASPCDREEKEGITKESSERHFSSSHCSPVLTVEKDRRRVKCYKSATLAFFFFKALTPPPARNEYIDFIKPSWSEGKGTNQVRIRRACCLRHLVWRIRFITA